MSSDSLCTYIIDGKKYAARSVEQARLAHRLSLKSQTSPPDKWKEAPRLARTQPYHKET